MATFVLVHGGFNGGWVWGRVAPILRSSGHDVFSPTLTGVGERAHLANPSVNLSTHIEDVANVLRFEELSDVILVGHSYGGMVVSGVAAVIPNRLRSLVYIDAAHPLNGESLADLNPAVEGFRRAAMEHGDGWLVPVPERNRGLSDADAAWVSQHLTPQPLATFEEPVRTVSDDELPRWWVLHCTEGIPAEMRARHEPAKSAGRYVEMLGPHSVMVSSPVAVAAMLNEVERSNL